MTLLLFSSFFILLLLGIPVAIAIALSSITVLVNEEYLFS